MTNNNVKFSVGDTVIIIPYDEISAKFVHTRTLPSGCYFPREMEKYCDTVCTVESVIEKGRRACGFYKLSGIKWTFTDEMLEAYFENTNDNAMSFDELMNFS